MTRDAAPDWTPDQPLLAWASDEQMQRRLAYLSQSQTMDGPTAAQVVLGVIREYGYAVLIAERNNR